jgi:putative flippase GtrA
MQVSLTCGDFDMTILKNSWLQKVYKFSVVGLSGVATNMLSTLVLKEIFFIWKNTLQTLLVLLWE